MRANRLVRRPLFPGYLFVGVDPEVARWRSINSTFGVNRLITTRSNHPQSVPISLMRELLLGCDERDLVLPPVQLSVGDQVRVVEGPFKNIVASVAKASDSQRIALLLEIMGRATRVKIANKDVELVRAV